MRGLTNGEVKDKIQRRALHNIAIGQELTNGAVRDGGMTNGVSNEGYEKGFTNGMGEGYASGFTNGIASSGLEVRQIRKPRSRGRKWQFLTVFIVVLAVISAPFITSFLVNDAPIMIDGVFKDWADVAVYSDGIGEVANSNVDIQTYKIQPYGSKVYVYISTVDYLLKGDGDVHDTIVVMADTDAKYETGYQANGLGYDYMVMVSGCYGEVVNEKGYSYQGSGDDWNKWKAVRSEVNIADNEMEVAIQSATPEFTVIDAYVISATGDVDQIDCLLSNNYQAFRISQENTVPEISSVGNVDVLSLNVACDVNSTVVNSIRFTKLGTARDSSFGRFSLEDSGGVEVGHGFINNGVVQVDTSIVLTEGDSINYTLSVNMQEQASGDTHMFEIQSPYDVVSSIVPKIKKPEKQFSYIGYVPTEVRIDGGFAEWDMKGVGINSAIDNPDVDIICSDYRFDDGNYSMAIGYGGKAMAGDNMPFNVNSGRKRTSVGNSAGQEEEQSHNTNYTYTPVDPKTGEDILQVRFGDDARVEIRGIGGRITKSVWSVRDGGNWTEMGSIDAYCDEHGVEFTVSGIEVDVENVTITTSDWRGRMDISRAGGEYPEISFGTRSSSENPETPSQTVGNNTHLIARMTHYPVVVDGVIDYASHGEWYPSEYYLVDLTRDIDVGVQYNDNFDSVYFYVVSYTEASNDVGDYAEIYLDTDDDETSAPDVDDVKFRLYQNDTLVYYEGNGTDWVQTTIPANCSGANTYIGNPDRNQNYEFNISWDVVNKNNRFETHMDTVGFGSHVYLAGETDHVWYPSQYSSTETPTTQYDAIPSEWGNVVYNDWTKNMTQYSSINPPTIDGVLNETEWETHGSYHTFTKTQTMSFYFMANETHWWYGGMLDNDDVLNADDFCQIFFGTGYSGETSLYPDADDIGFSLSGDNSTIYYVGTGSGWSSKTIPDGWEGKVAYTNGTVTYEIQGLMSNLSAGTGFNESGDVILFLNLITDAGVGGYTLQYPDALFDGTNDMRYDPHTWVHLALVIPEGDFTIMATFMLGVVGFAMFKRRKDEDCNGG